MKPELWGCIMFGPKMVHLPHTIFFWKQSLMSISSTYWPLLLCKILKKLPEIWGCICFGPKIAYFPKSEFFFSKAVNKPLFLSFEPIYVPKFKVWYSSTNEILTIKEYWNLIGQEHFLVVTWEPDFSQACSFHRMLMNQKNFRFTQTPDKTKDMISLKSLKTLFLGHFWSFLPGEDFFKKILLSHTTILGSLTPC